MNNHSDDDDDDDDDDNDNNINDNDSNLLELLKCARYVGTVSPVVEPSSGAQRMSINMP